MDPYSPNNIAQSLLLQLEVAPANADGTEPLWQISSPEGQAIVSTNFLFMHQSHFRKSHVVVVFNEAKPLLRTLLRSGIDVARPVCLKTIETVTKSATCQGSGFDRLAILLETVDGIKCPGLVRLECLVLRAFASMEEKGLHIDAPKWSQLISQKREEARLASQTCETILAPFTEKDLFGAGIINFNQPEEMRLLFEKAIGKPITGIGNELLGSLNHPLAKAFLAYREASKLVSTYGDRFLEYVDPKTQRIHAEFNSLGSSTGRVSCQKPNLQNLPSDPQFEECLSPPTNRALIRADFSACELRILAGFAHDANFLTAINSDEDFHSVVASQLFDVKVSKSENAELRQRAKAINFGIIYGMGPRGLARSLDISDDEAHKILALYFSRFPGVRDFLENCVSSAKSLGYARTLLGRRLYFDSMPGDSHEGFDISRIAKNMPIQGTAAELAKLAMVRVHERLIAEFKSAFLVNMIHDELVVECDNSDAPAVMTLVKTEMLGAQEALFQNVRPEVEISHKF